MTEPFDIVSTRARAIAIRGAADDLIVYLDEYLNAVPYVPTPIRQRKPVWANSHLGTSQVGAFSTIGTYGCLVTDIAYVLNCIVGMDSYDPVKVNAALLSVNGYQDGNLVIWEKLAVAFPFMKLEQVVDTPLPVSPAQFAMIDASLAKGIPVIVKVYNGPTREIKYQHFIALTKKDGDNYWIMDPWYEDTDAAGQPMLAKMMPRYPKAPGAKTAANAIEKFIIFSV